MTARIKAANHLNHPDPMATILKASTVAERSKEFISAWRQFAPDLMLAGRTLAEFEAESQLPKESEREVYAAKTHYKGAIATRNQATEQVKQSLRKLTHAVLADPAHGDNSAFYRSLGFIVQRERKRPGPKPKRTVIAVAPAAEPL
jgi:hypothetical protein